MLRYAYAPIEATIMIIRIGTAILVAVFVFCHRVHLRTLCIYKHIGILGHDNA